MAASTTQEEWATRQERGTLPLIRLAVWIVLHVGPRAGQLLLLPACAYFFLFSRQSRAASLAYLARVLGRPPNDRRPLAALPLLRHLLARSRALAQWPS